MQAVIRNMFVGLQTENSDTTVSINGSFGLLKHISVFALLSHMSTDLLN